MIVQEQRQRVERERDERKLRDGLRAERKSRFEEVRIWVPTIISVVSTVIAVFTVLHAVWK